MNTEQAEILGWFMEMLALPTADGGAKRTAGEKPSWKVDTSHEAAIFSHLNKWKHGEKRDATSGAHPLVHLAWRALAIAWQETHIPAISEEGVTIRYAPNTWQELPYTVDSNAPGPMFTPEADANISTLIATSGSFDVTGTIEHQQRLAKERYAKELERRRLMDDQAARDANPVIHPDEEALQRARERAARRTD